MTKKTIIVDEYRAGASAQAFHERVQQMHDDVSKIHQKHDGIAAVRALDGRVFATLSDEEMAVLNLYRATGRKFGVSVSIDNDPDPNSMTGTVSREQADQILKRAKNRVHVLVAG